MLDYEKMCNKGVRRYIMDRGLRHGSQLRWVQLNFPRKARSYPDEPIVYRPS